MAAKIRMIGLVWVVLFYPLVIHAALRESQILGDFKSFLAYRWTPGHGEALLKTAKLVQDDRNAYLQAADIGEAYAEVYTFVYWKMNDGTRVYGFSEASEGPEGSAFKTTFWRHLDSGWKPLENTLPALTLADFSGGSGPIPDARYLRYVQFDFTLPRTGTRLAVRIRAIDSLALAERGADHPEDRELLTEAAYEHALKRLTSSSLELIWDSRTGRFARVERRRSGNPRAGACDKRIRMSWSKSAIVRAV